MNKDYVGDVRPTQLMYTYGVGAIVDLPKISVIVTGLDDWPSQPPAVKPIIEDRLLMAVRSQEGMRSVRQLLAPPKSVDDDFANPFDRSELIGVPVATFPRWLVCPRCRRLASVQSGLFKLDAKPFRPDQTVYRHINCNKGQSPEVLPVRFLAACERGHLDDFPWEGYVHNFQSCLQGTPLLRLTEYGPSGEARDVEVECETCGKKRRLAQAFGEENRKDLPLCNGRRPHLRDYDETECDQTIRPIILGASNMWFPVVLSAIAIPVESGKLAQLVTDYWAVAQKVTSFEVLQAFRSIGQLAMFSTYKDDEIWAAIQAKREQDAGNQPAPDATDLKSPEWQVLTQFDPNRNGDDFRLRPVAAPQPFASMIRQVVLAERLREVRAMIGFTRIDSIGEMGDPDLEQATQRAPLSRFSPEWVPADEVRGEGIFIQFDEEAISRWVSQSSIKDRADSFFEAHKRWRASRRLDPPEAGFPGMRYALLHSFSHALMRQLALECGYTSASIRERIYSRDEVSGEPMAGILIYTSAPDSEGTLGGLVSLGEPETLGRHIAQALEAMRLCASDPLCAEHEPSRRGQTLHGAACHACLFAPETSCERGNKYLDRSVLVRTVENDQFAFFQ